MAEVTDPNAAPMHHDIVEKFAGIHVAVALALGVVATVVGIVLGLVFVND
jgi:hypothetical protein